MAKPLDLKGCKFGKLTAIRWTGRSVFKYGRVWLCKCECGSYREVPVMFLRNHSIEQCVTCGKKSTADRERRFVEKITNALRTQRRDKLRHVWQLMKDRCYNPKCKSYKWYGEKGIHICNEWLNNYDKFKEWAISNGYSEDLTIERNDIKGDYSPDNCRFVTRREQTYNRTNSLYIIFEGKTIPVGEIIYELGLNKSAFVNYLRNYIQKK